MRYLPGFIFCFLSAFVVGVTYPNAVKADDYQSEFLQNSDKTSSLEYALPAPDVVLVDVKISGKVQHGGSNSLPPFAGVTVTFSGLGSVVTNDTGYYEKFVPELWTGTVTPYYCGYYNFSPASRTYTKIKVNAVNQDFVGTPAQMFTINGTIIETINNLPLADYTINFGNGFTATTNSQGQYSIQVKPCGSYTLTPTSADYNFVPLSRNYPNITTNFSDQDYEATPSSFPRPPGWDYPLTGSAHIISIMPYANPTICGVPLNEGDWIGVFYVGDDGLLQCGGAGMYQGTTVSTAVIAQGDDFTTPVKDGFDSFEVMNWKVFSSSTTQQEFIAFPTTFSGDSYKWGSMGLTRIISLPAYKTHNLVIPQGWSGISSYLKPATSLPLNNIPSAAPRSGADSIRRIMMPIISKLSIVQNLTKTYWPSQNVNTIGKWSATSGYKIKVTEPIVLPIHGCDYSPRTISLITGWNLIPVLSECSIPIESLFAAHLNKITIIKEIAGSFIYWPAMNIKTLLTLQTGKAYLMMVSADFSVTFPACTAFKAEEILQTPFKNNSPWNDPAMTPSNHSIALPSGVLGKLMAGDIIGAFTEDGTCAGLVEINDVSQSYLLQVFGDDQTTLEKDGFDESEFLSLKLFRPQLNQVFEIGFDFDATMPSSDGVFTSDGLSAVGKIVFNPTYIGENTNTSISFFPNPANGLVEFVAGDLNRKFKVTILDLTGQKVDETMFSGKTMIDVSHSPKGIYLVKIESADFIKFEKLIIQ
jgi:hypothetical protein